MAVASSLQPTPLTPQSPTPRQIVAACTCWLSFQAMFTVNRYWGIIHNGWAPCASFVTAAVLFATTACCWLVMGRTGKRCLVGFQVGLQLLYAVTCTLAVLSYLIPAQIDDQVRFVCGVWGLSLDCRSQHC